MKKIKLIALFAAVVVGLGLYQFLKEIGKPEEIPRTDVVVAVSDIPSNTLITENMIMLKPIATEAVLSGCINHTEEAVGMISSVDIYDGEQLINNRLIGIGDNTSSNNTLAYMVDPGMRAVSVSVNAVSGIENLLRPGNRVDVLVNVKYKNNDESELKEKEEIIVSKTIMENIEVLAVGSVMTYEGATEYVTITLHVTPQQALLINYAGAGEEVTGLRLLLRSPLDNEPMENTEVYLKDILGESVISDEPEYSEINELPVPEGGDSE